MTDDDNHDADKRLSETFTDDVMVNETRELKEGIEERGKCGRFIKVELRKSRLL